MQSILEAMTGQEAGGARHNIAALVDQIRPANPKNAGEAVNKLRTLCYLLEHNPCYRSALRRQLDDLLGHCTHVRLYSDTGILSNEGFFSTIKRRIGYRILPPVADSESLKDLFGAIFHRRTDYLWLGQIPRTVWQEFDHALNGGEPASTVARTASALQLLEAIQILTCRIAAIGLEPEMAQNYPAIEDFESPFVRQQVETLQFIESCLVEPGENRPPAQDSRHILVLLDQCEEVIAKVRRNTQRHGISVSLTYHLLRLTQHIERMRLLLQLADPAAPENRLDARIELFLTLVRAENRKYNLRDVIRENTELLALQVTEQASLTGEHYIAENREEWVKMFRSAAGAGVIVGFMALIKIMTAGLHLPPLLEAAAFSLNYALGFMLVHILHMTIATKQPAMTAARIAASLPQAGKKNASQDELVELIIKVFRTQYIAILGNVLLVMPVALGIAWLFRLQFGQHVADAEKAGHMLNELQPVAGFGLAHAAIAGVCLFLAGLISGYYDNKALYQRIPERIAALPWLNRLIGTRRTSRLASYIEHNLGALAGNFYFGIMLGSLGTLGFLLGLPIDIRHITFSAANMVYAFFALDFSLDWRLALQAFGGVALIGLANLYVSFFLALWVALRSRKRRLSELKPLAGKLVRRFWQRPFDCLIPPREMDSSHEAAASASEINH